MANKVVIVTHPDVTTPSGKKLPLGECSVDEKLAEKLISRKLAKASTKTKKISIS